MQRLSAGAERGDAEALHVRCVLVEQRDPLAEREPTEQIVDALAYRQRGVAERMPLGRREGRKNARLTSKQAGTEC